VKLQGGTYTTLHEAIDALVIKRVYKNQLRTTARLAEKFNEKSESAHFRQKEYVALLILRQQVTLYRAFRILSKEDGDKLNNIINLIIKNL
jgi:hypothetical protein